MFKTVDDLIRLFDFDSHPIYSNIIRLQNRQLGFVVRRKYTDANAYKPPKFPNGDDDVVALIKVTSNNSSEKEDKEVPVTISITTYSIYKEHHWDYDFNDPHCPQKDSVELSRSTPRPISLRFIDEFFYNFESKSFTAKDNNKLSGIEMLENAYRRHCDTIHPLKGLFFRCKIQFINNILSPLADAVIKLFKWILTYPLGRDIKPEDPIAAVFSGYRKNEIIRRKTKMLKFIIYESSRNVILTYCIIILLLSYIVYFRNVQISFLKIVFREKILLIPSIILSLAFLELLIESLAPKVILWLLNKMINMKLKVRFTPVKF